MICAPCGRTNRPNARFCANCRAPLLLQNKYKITRLLGRGGYGAVYLAEQLHLGGAVCAIKELFSDANATPQQAQQSAQQFLFEASVLAKLNHPGLPRVTDFFNEGSRYYLAMDYVEGDTLEERLARNGSPLPESQVATWTAELCDILTYLHTRQPNPVIHRDIKPSNIKITPEGRVELIDFGIAKLLVSGVGTIAAARAVSPPYAPMEQYGTGTDTRSDVYALGVTMYQLSTNQLPPEAPDRATQGVIPPRRWNVALTANMDDVILKAMAEKPAERFQSAAEMKQALNAKRIQPQQIALPSFQPPAMSPQPVAYTAVTQPRVRTATAIWAILAAILVTVISLNVIIFGVAQVQKQQAQATAIAEAMASETAIAFAAKATATAQTVATAQAIATATGQAQATATAQAAATAGALATDFARANAQATARAQTTASARASLTIQARAQLTSRARDTIAQQATQTAVFSKVTFILINNYHLNQDLYLDDQFLISVDTKQQVTTFIKRGFHKFQSCFRGRNPRDNPENCGDPKTYEVQTDTWTHTIYEQ